MGTFESAPWAGDMAVWIPGEAELVTVRLADGWNINKHDDMTSPDDLEIALDELAALITRGIGSGRGCYRVDCEGAVARSSAVSGVSRGLSCGRRGPNQVPEAM